MVEKLKNVLSSLERRILNKQYLKLRSLWKIFSGWKRFENSENEICQNDLDEASPVSYIKLFRYATTWDIMLMIIGSISTFVQALGMPGLFVVYGEFTTLLVDRTLGYGTSSTTIVLHIFGGGKILTNATWEENSQEIINDGKSFGLMLLVFTLILFIAGILAVDCFNQAAIRQITRIRIEYFRSLMRQEIGWYDVYGNSDNFAVRITEDIERIRDGIAEKVSHFLLSIMTAVICVTISFIFGWKLTLVVVLYIPFVVITNLAIGKFQASLSVKEQNYNSAAANVAEEVLSGIRTIFAFGGEHVEIERYNSRLMNAKQAARMKGLLTGICGGILRFLFFAVYALGYWYGVQLVLDDRHKVDKEYTPAVLMITFFGLIFGAGGLSRLAPFLETFAAARASAATIFKVIDRPSKIDSMSTNGNSSNVDINGSISFKNVHFSYPSRPETQILKGLDLEIEGGQSVAIVGHSGNGKSTCLQLIQRFYDPDDGKILIDGNDTRSININSLRSRIATVGQEPVLFSTTIGENIRYGKPDATDSEMILAAQNSGAHDFISRLPHGYNTMVGEKGSKLSGGQKQRIAIARALIQNPKILLLDEATSALDYQSEKFIQETLDRVSKGRTTITVSHRISAIQSADRIVFLEKGIIIEDGTHNQLLAMKGRYYEMISAGSLNDDNNNDFNVNNATINMNDIQMLSKQKFSTDENDLQQLSMDDKEKGPAEKSNDDFINYTDIIYRILKLAQPEWSILLLASIAALLIGTSLPIFCILFGEMYGNLANADEAMVREESLSISMVFLVAGLVTFIASFAQMFWLSKASVNLVTRFRSKTFESMMQQECGWFDEEDNSSAVLASRLTTDAGSWQNLIGLPLGWTLQAISTFLFSIIVSMSYSLKLSLVGLTSLPLALASVVIESLHTSKTAIIEKKSLEAGTKIASEAVTNIRTVASLRQEKHMIERFVHEMTHVEKVIGKKMVWRGLVNSFAQNIPMLAYAYTLYYSSYLIAAKELHFKNAIKVTEMIFSSCFQMGQALVFAPTFTAAIVGAHRLFQIIDRKPMIKSPPNTMNKVHGPNINNNIEYKQIDFRYPTRPDVQILNNLNLKVHEGQTMALVGPSGCGKSTCIQLLQRLYDPEYGCIYLGPNEISSEISLDDLRSKLSIVSQEPVLFDKTIAENIAYGDTSREVSMDEIIDAAKMANIHNFIVELPTGYETNVGNKTAQLSGGQRQRIAIARALIRNPKILLLDEATSSLDLQSEQVVQQALDSARSGRTCLIIAHRLSTIQNADAIYVLCGGNIVEHGTHSDLLTSGGQYARLYNSQKKSC